MTSSFTRLQIFPSCRARRAGQRETWHWTVVSYTNTQIDQFWYVKKWLMHVGENKTSWRPSIGSRVVFMSAFRIMVITTVVLWAHRISNTLLVCKRRGVVIVMRLMISMIYRTIIHTNRLRVQNALALIRGPRSWYFESWQSRKSFSKRRLSIRQY